jgi:hypothetical protein
MVSKQHDDTQPLLYQAGEKSKRAANPMEKDQPPRTMIVDRVEKGGCKLDPITIMS